MLKETDSEETKLQLFGAHQRTMYLCEPVLEEEETILCLLMAVLCCLGISIHSAMMFKHHPSMTIPHRASISMP